MKKFLLLILSVLVSCPVFAFTYTYQGQTLNYEIVDESAKTCKVVGYQTVAGELVIPSQVSYNGNTYTVTEIGKSAFENCISLTSVTIPNSITSIGGVAFKDCLGLTSVSIGNSVTSIGEEAFKNCHILTKAEFTSIESICSISFEVSTSNPLCYAHNLYIAGHKITNLVIPETVTSIGDYALVHCGLTSLTIPNSVTSIGEDAFEYCNDLTSATIGNSVTSIGKNAFSHCTGLTSLTIPNSVTSIGSGAFKWCWGLTSVTIGNSVTEIGSYAFTGCSGLTSVTIPNSVISIGGSAFSTCSSLTSVMIPNSVTHIGNEAFFNCSCLTSVYYQAKDPISASDNVFSNATYQQAKLYVPDVAVEKCKTIDPWKNFASIEAYDFDGIEAIAADFDDDKPFEVYDLNGAMIGNSLEALPAGFYILRQGSAAKKIMIQ